MSSNPTLIETPRLLLRDIDVKTDLDMWTDMMSDEDTVRYIGGEVLSREKSWRQIAMVVTEGAVGAVLSGQGVQSSCNMGEC